MLHSPLFYLWIGWVLVVGAIAVGRGVYARRENTGREQQHAERAARQVGAVERARLAGVEPDAGSAFSITLTVVLSNTGATIPAGLPVGIYADGTRIAALTGPAVASGQTVTQTVIWPVAHAGDYELAIVPNDGGAGGEIPPLPRPLPLCAAPAPTSQKVSVLDLALVGFWNLISSRINPFDPDITVVQRSISGTYAVIQNFDQGARSYYPYLPPGFNTLRTVDAAHGYWTRQWIVCRRQETGGRRQGPVNRRQAGRSPRGGWWARRCPRISHFRWRPAGTW